MLVWLQHRLVSRQQLGQLQQLQLSRPQLKKKIVVSMVVQSWNVVKRSVTKALIMHGGVVLNVLLANTIIRKSMTTCTKRKKSLLLKNLLFIKRFMAKHMVKYMDKSILVLMKPNIVKPMVKYTDMPILVLIQLSKRNLKVLLF
uniref:Uncharacterized protein n=1 Tax=Acrobeloides nanus TaxID=290746 RepID=A0A914DYP2_9BILA